MASFSTAEVESLTALMDKNFGFRRPDTQRVGFSGEVDDVPSAEGHSVGLEGDASSELPKAARPGGVHIPATVVNRTLGLPAPSLSKEAKAMELAKQSMERGPKAKGNDIWAAEEVANISERGNVAKVAKPTAAAGASSSGAAAGGKVEPEHEVLYKQIMSAEDVYLGVDFSKDGSSGLSDGVVVKVKLPKAESAKHFNLEVQPFVMILETPDYYLRAHLPTKVVEKKANAKWDATKKLLTVSLTADLSDKNVKVIA